MSDTVRERVQRMSQGSMTLQLAFVGVANHLFEALAGQAPHSPRDLALKAGLDAGYVERWCEAAFAFELLERMDQGYVLGELGAAFLPGPGTLLPAAAMAAMQAHLAHHAAVGMWTGAQPGEVVLGEKEAIAPLFGSTLELSFRAVFEREVLGQGPLFGGLEGRALRAVDLACGNGWTLRSLAARHPGLVGIGIDGMEVNITQARAESAAFGERLSFHVADVLDPKVEGPFDLIFMHRALHHVWDARYELVEWLEENLAPGGFVAIWEPRWPTDLQELRQGPSRGLAFQNLAEHVQGNRFLRLEEVLDLLADAGLLVNRMLIQEGREMVVTGARA